MTEYCEELLDEIIEQGAESLNGSGNTSYDSLREVEGEKYLIFPSRGSSKDGVETLTAEQIKAMLNEELEYPVMSSQKMAMNRVNSEEERILIARVEDGELSNMGYVLEDNNILAAFPFTLNVSVFSET